MVLAELGQKITSAINMMSKAMVIDEDVIGKMTNSISLALLQSDVDIKLVASMKKKINKKLAQEVGGGLSKRKHVESVVVKEIFNLLDSGTKAFEPEKGKSNVIMFVGLQGAGKTTTCTKYAQYYKKKGWKTCLVCADTFRAGAFDQLKQNASKIKIPFYGSYTGITIFCDSNLSITPVHTAARA
jgi:signal recognition particle subunit SRP54